MGVEGRGWRGGGSGERARISKVVVVGRVRTREKIATFNTFFPRERTLKGVDIIQIFISSTTFQMTI